MQMQPIQQSGGSRMTVFEESVLMSGHFILLALVLVCVYVSRVPLHVLSYFKSTGIQVLGLFIIITLTTQYGWIHGIIAALAFSLLVSRALRLDKEHFTSIVPLIFSNNDDINIVSGGDRWFSEKILNENPSLISEKTVRTNAVQDLSERTMGSQSSPVSR